MVRAIQRVVFPTDFGPNSAVVFTHALRIAFATSAELRVLHVARRGSSRPAQWERLPNVETLARKWRPLPPDASDEDYARLLDTVHAETLVGSQPATVLTEELHEHPADVLVIGTSGRTGMARVTQGSIAERVARQSGTTTMFVGPRARALVDPSDGFVTLERVLVPIARGWKPELQVEAAVAFVDLLSPGTVELDFVHVGSDDDFPEVHPSVPPGVVWWRESRSGSVVEEILKAAEEHGSDLIVMATRGHDSLADVLAGSHTEQTVREARCPVLAIPIL